MNRLLLFIFLLPIGLFGQSAYSPTKAELTKTYTQAIGDFIKAANKKNKITFDTLYFGKRKNGQADDFPNIELPKTIEKTHIRLISPETAAKKLKEKPSRIYVNLMGWMDIEKADFLFVVFSNGFQHQYDYSINYKYNTKLKAFELEKVEFKGPPFK